MPQQYVAICTCGQKNAFDSGMRVHHLECARCHRSLLAAQSLYAPEEGEVTKWYVSEALIRS